MASIALIACDHGFGHVRRALLIAGGLVERGARVTLFAPTATVERLSGASGAGFRLMDFRTCTTEEALCAGSPETSRWIERLPTLAEFDLVVSDNLPEVLTVRPDAILSGSFLWHLALERVNAGIARNAEHLLAMHRPRMLTSRVFAMPHLAQFPRMFYVGLCCAGPRPEAPGKDLLIACGGSEVMEQPFRSLIASIARDSQPPFPRVFVEPRLFPKAAPEWMQRATFDDAMYRLLGAAVCRAGVGTMTDCLWAKARVFTASEAGNAEVECNANSLAAIGVGEAAATPLDAFRGACGFATDSAARAAHLRAVEQVDFAGVRQIVDLLLAW